VESKTLVPRKKERDGQETKEFWGGDTRQGNGTGKRTTVKPSPADRNWRGEEGDECRTEKATG